MQPDKSAQYYNDLITENPVRAARELRSLLHEPWGQDPQHIEIPFIIQFLPQLFKAAPDRGQYIVRAIRNYHLDGRPDLNAINVRRVIDALPAILRTEPSSGPHVVAALLEGVSGKAQQRIIAQLLEKMPKLIKKHRWPVHEMMAALSDRLTDSTPDGVLCSQFARLRRRVASSMRDVWFIPARGENGEVRNIFVLSGSFKVSAENVRPDGNIGRETPLIANMLRGQMSPENTAIALRTRDHKYLVLAM